MNALDPLVWSILLMLVGCVVLVLEVFIPSGGMLAVISTAAFVGSILIAFQRGPVTGFTFVLSTVVAVPLVLVAGVSLSGPRRKSARRFSASCRATKMSCRTIRTACLLGRVGVARSKMLPSGAVEIDGQMVDAIEPRPGRSSRASMSSSPKSGPTASSCGRPKRTSAPAEPSNPADLLSRRSKSWASSRSKIRWRESETVRLRRGQLFRLCTAEPILETPPSLAPRDDVGRSRLPRHAARRRARDAALSEVLHARRSQGSGWAASSIATHSTATPSGSSRCGPPASPSAKSACSCNTSTASTSRRSAT